MKKIDVLVNKNKFKLEYELKSQSSTINDIIEFVNKIKGFPVKATVDITVDNSKRERNFLVKDAIIPIVYIDFSEIIEQLTIQYFSKDDEHKIFLEKIDTCWQLLELEKLIAKKIDCYEYSIRIIKKNKMIEKNILLCQILLFQQEIQYLVVAKFYINYNQKQLFQIDAFQRFDQIKQKVRQKLGIQQEIDLIYEGKLLDDKQKYFSYSIPQCAELKLIIKNKQDIKIWYRDTIYKYNVSTDMTIQQLLTYFKDIHSLHKNQQLQIQLKNMILDDMMLISNLELSNEDELYVEAKIKEKPMVIKFVQKGKDQISFQFNVSNLDQVYSIYNLQLFKGKRLEFFVNDQQLQITQNLIFDQIQFPSENLQISYEILQNQLITVSFQDDDNEIEQIQVNPQDVINDVMKKKKFIENTKIKAYKQGQLIDLDGTYQTEGINDGDIINYYLAELIVKIMINSLKYDQPQIKEIKMPYLATIKDLKQKVSDQYDIYESCKILVDGQTLLDPVQLKDINKNAIFRISRYLNIKIEIMLENDTEQSEGKFYETDKILVIKDQYQEMFGSEVAIKDENGKYLGDDEEISFYEKKVLRISQKNIAIKYQIDNFQQKAFCKEFDKSITLKEMLKIITNRKSRCYIANKLMDENIMLVNLNLASETVIQIECIKRAQLIDFNDGRNKRDLDFYPEEIINKVVSLHIQGTFTIQFNNRDINKENTFKAENIQNEDKLFYKLHLRIQIINQDTNQLLLSEAFNPNQQIGLIIRQINTSKLKVYYSNRELNQNKTLQEEGLPDNAIIFIKDYKKLLKLHIDGNVQNIYVNQERNLHNLKSKHKLNYENYELYQLNNQGVALKDDVLLKNLINQNNEIELIYKLGNNYIKIKLYDSDNRRYTEYVNLNSQIKTFQQDFGKKYKLNVTDIFLDGRVIEKEMYFSQIQLNQYSELEIIADII